MAFIAPADQRIKTSGGKFVAPKNEMLANPTDGPSGEEQKDGLVRRLATSVIDSPAIPIASGIVGSIIGTPMVGGAIGAAGGEAARQLGKRALESGSVSQFFTDPNIGLPSGQAALNIGMEGVSSIGGDIVGQGVVKGAKYLALPAARRALGFASRFLKTEGARESANRAARVALEKDIIPILGSPQVAFDNASRLAKSVGSRIGNVLKNIDFYKIAPDAEYEMNVLRRKLNKGTDRGLFTGANAVIDDVKETIVSMYGKGLSAKDYNDAKNILASKINFFTDNASQRVNKRVVGQMAETIRSSVRKLVPESFEEFIKNQRLFNAAELMKKALNDELGKQMGNRVPSLASTASAAARLTAGDVPGALGSIGLVEAAQRRGTGIAARGLKTIGDRPGAVRGVSRGAAQSIPFGLGFGQRREEE